MPYQLLLGLLGCTCSLYRLKSWLFGSYRYGNYIALHVYDVVHFVTQRERFCNFNSRQANFLGDQIVARLSREPFNGATELKED